jgi:hypothetical protein
MVALIDQQRYRALSGADQPLLQPVRRRAPVVTPLMTDRMRGQPSDRLSDLYRASTLYSRHRNRPGVPIPAAAGS